MDALNHYKKLINNSIISLQNETAAYKLILIDL